MTSLKKIVQSKLKRSKTEVNNNVAKNVSNPESSKPRQVDKTLYNSNIEDSILTGSQYVPINLEFPYVRKKSVERSRASTSSSTDKHSYASFLLVFDDKGDIADDSEFDDWEATSREQITASIYFDSLLQKYCQPKPKNAWCKFKSDFLRKFRSKVNPMIVTG